MAVVPFAAPAVGVVARPHADDEPRHGERRRNHVPLTRERAR